MQTELQRMNCTSVDELKVLLEKRATFQRGVRCLASALEDETLYLLFPLVSRTYTLLKSRYTSPELWKSGVQAFTQCMKCSNLSPEQQSKLQTYMADAKAYLQEIEEADTEENSGASSNQQHAMRDPATMLNTLLGLEVPFEQEPRAHLTDAGWIRVPATNPQIVTAPDNGPAEGTTEQQISSTSDNTAQGPNETGATDADAAARARRQEREQIQRSILEGIHAVYEGVAAVTRGTEAVERELQQVLDMMRAGGGEGGPKAPPMSKKVFSSLPVVELDESRLSQMESDTRCAVCTDSLAVGDKVIQLPCKGKHWYHPACVKPWVDKTNSCPVCREELPTDDPHYEAKKEKDAEMEEEARGAANALSHNEFMYI